MANVEWGRGGCSQGFGIAPKVLEGSQGFGGIPGFWSKMRKIYQNFCERKKEQISPLVAII